MAKKTIEGPRGPGPAREGKKMVAAYVTPETWRELHNLGLDQGGKPIQSLLEEAIGLLFQKHKRSLTK